mmetsp:Transcript_21733/g.38947  ORF Transcript_21733/g.38947 Transcript_21733/m.38947 type:complete len:102 (-) Transcript_21733:103-408(-)
MPWMCGCTGQMAVMGTVPIELEGLSDDACIVSSGAPTGFLDQQMVDLIMADSGYTKNAAGKYAKTASGLAATAKATEAPAAAPAPQTMEQDGAVVIGAKEA